MERIFIRDIGRRGELIRWIKGMVENYPVSTWKHIAKGAGMALDRFSTPIEHAANKGIAKSM